MQTIIYQGQEVQATLVNYLSGTIPTSTVDAEGDEELFRDEAGRYYLRRKLNLLADHHEDDGEGNIDASGRTHVHRISVNAAVLWATTRLNSETLALRSDAAGLLTEGRTYLEPAERAAGWTTAKLQALADGDRPLAVTGTTGRITVELDEVASAMLRRVCREGSTTREAGEDPRDLVNAAVTFYLCGDSDSCHGEFNLEDGGDVLARAKQDRLRLEGRAA